MKIAIDVDGVLADVIHTWIDYNNTKRARITKQEITEWNFWENFQIKEHDFCNELSMCWKSWNNIPPTENTLSYATETLSKLGSVDIVTAREPHTDSYVKNWLKSQNIVYHDYISVDSGPNKAKLNYDVFIDDSPINALEIINSGKKILLYSQPWNDNLQHPQVERISQLNEAINMIQRISA